MGILITCDACQSNADAASDECPENVAIWTGGDPVDGSNAEPVVEMHLCSTCKACFFDALPDAVRARLNEQADG